MGICILFDHRQENAHAGRIDRRDFKIVDNNQITNAEIDIRIMDRLSGEDCSNISLPVQDLCTYRIWYVESI
jgi:hypothetical protein